MQVFRICPRHHRRFIRGERCPECPGPRHAHRHRNSRAVALERDGHRCTAVEKGARCPVTTGLVAHHVEARIAGGLDVPENYATVCTRHHEQLEAAKRKRGER